MGVDEWRYRTERPFNLTLYRDRKLIAWRNPTLSRDEPEGRRLATARNTFVELPKFAAWALKMGWDIPPELAQFANEREPTEPDQIVKDTTVVQPIQRPDATRDALFADK
jgi:hypothetical protein